MKDKDLGCGDNLADLVQRLLKEQQECEKAARKDVAEHVRSSHEITMRTVENLFRRR
jgi:hypothetical protein